MIRYLGRTLGVLVGLAAGIPGAIFGLLAGWLLDQVLAVRRTARRARAFFSDPDSEKDPGRALMLGIAGLGHALMSSDGPPKRSQVMKFLSESWPGVSSRNRNNRKKRTETYHLVMREVGRVDHRLVSTSLVKHLDKEQRDSLVAFLAIVAGSDGYGIVVSERRTLREIGIALGVSPHTLKEVEQTVGDLDPSACLILGVTPSATIEEIRTSYRKLAAQLHPDTAQALEEHYRKQMTEAFHRVRTAYETLLTQVQDRDSV